ncbi:MAG: GNAT family N-acyltransferase [Legionellaceae bacterium]|nr:GNAT family N-acyltransferase [Legionellaceae bacterium]
MKKTPFKLSINAYDTTFTVQIAETPKEVESCIALRTRYFQSGATPDHALQIVDEDEYDKYCCHLMVIDNEINEAVGTYRLMRWDVAEKNIGYYCETEFDLSNIKRQHLKLVEMGRLCTASEYRHKNIVGMLWNGVYEYLDFYHLDYLSGSVSLPTDEPDLTSKIYAYAKYKNMLADPSFSVTPLPMCVDKTFDPNYKILDINKTRKELPKLFLAYLVLETKICGPSGHDNILNLNDFYILSNLKERHNNRRINRFKLKT